MGGSSPYEEPASAFVPQVPKCSRHSNKSPLTTMMKLLYGEPFGHGCRSIVSCLLQVVACGFWTSFVIPPIIEKRSLRNAQAQKGTSFGAIFYLRKIPINITS